MTFVKNRRILVIDDQESMHEDYRKVIGRKRPDHTALDRASANLFGEHVSTATIPESFEIDSAYQGEEGFRLVQKAIEEGRPYALAFVDVRMPPGWTGIDTVKRIWEIDTEILIVICSAYSDYSWEQMVEQLGQSDRFLILKKPFEQIEVRQFAMALTERWNLARNDSLTGLLNRRAFGEHLEHEHRRALAGETPLACAMLDLDFFKRINDEIGHAAGDLVLQSVADLLRRESRPGVYLCRFGGEEFCVLLPLADEAGALVWAESVRLAIAGLAILAEPAGLHVTVSIGVAATVADDSPQTLVANADRALRAAKQAGRNQVVTASMLQAPQWPPDGTMLFENPLSGVRAAEVLTSPIPLLHLSATIAEAANLVLRYDVTSLPVVDDSGALVGVVSERQILPQMLSPQRPAAKVRSIMQTTVVSYTEDAPVDRIFDFLSRVSIGQVFVVRDGRPIGTITRGSLLRWLSTWLSRGSKAAAAPPADLMEHARLHARQTADELARRASVLADPLADSEDASVLALIEIMFKMQELMNDLLVCSAARSATFGSECKEEKEVTQEASHV
jgi:diguanylate cyclase (GGDEF)-like protein